MFLSGIKKFKNLQLQLSEISTRIDGYCWRSLPLFLKAILVSFRKCFVYGICLLFMYGLNIYVSFITN